MSGSRTSRGKRRTTSASAKRATSLRDLRRARSLILSDPQIMSGDPVFRGTRVPVHMIAELLVQGSGVGELLQGYPRLTAEMVRLAPVYAAAYPLRTRPRNQPWSGQKPIHSARRSFFTRRPARS